MTRDGSTRGMRTANSRSNSGTATASASAPTPHTSSCPIHSRSPRTSSFRFGGYDYQSVRTGFSLGQQRKLSGFLSAEYGTFYDGHKTTISLSRGRLNLSPHLSIEPSVSVNWVDLVEGSFVSRLVTSRFTYTVTPRMFVSALVQYNSATHSVGTNLRQRWEYRPGSELFVVLNEQRDTLPPRFPELANRAFVIKVNRLFRL